MVTIKATIHLKLYRKIFKNIFNFFFLIIFHINMHSIHKKYFHHLILSQFFTSYFFNFQFILFLLFILTNYFSFMALHLYFQ